MKTINKIKLTVATLLTLTILTGCGGGGGGDASFENGSTAIAVASCNTSWTTVTKGDVVSATSATQLKFDHDSSGNKQVCVVSGTATIL